ncbi:MAG: alkaline phosphatase [Bacteroidales bacterium]|nr:alkaline phosphatase [Bacteroidales bacterium]
MKYKLIVILLLLPMLALAQRGKQAKQKTQEPTYPQPRNVIFIVGDGMGVPQVYSSIVSQIGDGSAFLRFPYTGFSRTYSNNRYTTDSGAGGSALMTGHKVDNYHIALGPDGAWYASFLTMAKLIYGKAAGFVVTSSVLDATPASTYAHVSNRHLKDSISMQMAQCGFEVMIGGNKNPFLPANRQDGLAPLDTLVDRGYTMAYDINELMTARSRRICGLLSPDNPPTQPTRGRWLTLSALKAIETLNVSDNGFVLMIEGSQIDWACHNNDSAYLSAEMFDFEDMLSAVLDFAQRDGNTLVVVTADHETGGLSLLGGDIEHGVNRYTFATGNHSGCMVPVFAFGPGAKYFSGIQQNTDFFQKIMTLLGGKSFGLPYVDYHDIYFNITSGAINSANYIY